MKSIRRKRKSKKKPGLQGSSGPRDKSLVSEGNRPTTALPLFTPDQVNNCDVHRSSKAKKSGVQWESIQIVDPNNPSAIRMIIRRVRGQDSAQKAGSCPQLSQQATQCPGLSQNALQQRHGEASASQVPGNLPCNLTGQGLVESPPARKRRYHQFPRPKWVIKTLRMLPGKMRRRLIANGRPPNGTGSRKRKRAAEQSEAGDVIRSAKRSRKSQPSKKRRRARKRVHKNVT